MPFIYEVFWERVHVGFSVSSTPPPRGMSPMKKVIHSHLFCRQKIKWSEASEENKTVLPRLFSRYVPTRYTCLINTFSLVYKLQYFLLLHVSLCHILPVLVCPLACFNVTY